MSRITTNYFETFMQRFMTKLDSSIKNYTNAKFKIPNCTQTTNGTYVLKATVSGNSVTYSWVQE